VGIYLEPLQGFTIAPRRRMLIAEG